MFLLPGQTQTFCSSGSPDPERQGCPAYQVKPKRRRDLPVSMWFVYVPPTKRLKFWAVCQAFLTRLRSGDLKLQREE